MRVGLLTEGGYPYATGDGRVWCDRLVRGLAHHEFEIYALSRSERQEAAGLLDLPPQVRRVHTAALWGPAGAALAGGARGRPGGRNGGRAPERTAGGAADRTAGRMAGLAAGRAPSRGAGRPYGRRERRRFAGHFAELAAAVCGAPAGDQADRFADGLYGLADLAVERGGLPGALRSDTAVRTLETACREPGAPQAAHAAHLTDLLAVLEAMEHTLRPLSLDWYGEDDGGLGSVDLCHATSGGAAALPGLLAQRFFGVPLLVTEYGVRLREHYLASAAAPLAAPVRALLASFQRQLAAEIYRQAAVITPGNTHARRWQEQCGADRAKLRTVYPGLDAGRFVEVSDAETERERERERARARSRGGVPDADGAGAWGPGPVGSVAARSALAGEQPRGRVIETVAEPDDRTLVWVGRIEPAKDLVSLLHAFARVRTAEPEARLRIVVTGPGRGSAAAAYDAHCRVLAAQLFPDEAESAVAVGDNPVTFEEIGGPELPDLAAAYAAGAVVVSSSVVEGFPVGLAESMLCGRATVSTDAGAVCEVIGGTGLVVPPRNPRALADACAALLRDPERRARLGAAARARALELFTVEQNVSAFRGIYLELMSHTPARIEPVDADGEPLPFALPPEAHVPGRWAASSAARAAAGQAAAGQAAVGQSGGPRAAAAQTVAGPPGMAARAAGGASQGAIVGEGGADSGGERGEGGEGGTAGVRVAYAGAHLRAAAGVHAGAGARADATLRAENAENAENAEPGDPLRTDAAVARTGLRGAQPVGAATAHGEADA